MGTDGGGMSAAAAAAAPFRDPAIKLFGRKIALPDSLVPSKPPQSKSNGCSIDEKPAMETERKGTKEANSSTDQDQSFSACDQDKEVMKKPDKVIPCPRCNSMETKFCYFNNYNVNQPRHFCKNCQRYWTAGGTMRNVPIGAGRRKNKHLASQYRQIMSETPENSQSSAESVASGPSSGNGVVLKFGTPPEEGPPSPLCQSMQNLMSLGDQSKFVERSSGTSCGSPPMTSENVNSRIDPEGDTDRRSSKDQTAVPTPPNHHPPPLQCYPVTPLIVPWNWNGMASVAANPQYPNQVQLCPSMPMLAIPPQLQFLPPASYLMWATATCPSPTSSSPSTLGKHSRDTSVADDGEKSEENPVLVPKTIRIDDPNEASKSSLWSNATALSPKQEQPSVLVTKGSIFRTFDGKSEGKVHVPDSAHILEANPAALSRSLSFQEGS